MYERRIPTIGQPASAPRGARLLAGLALMVAILIGAPGMCVPAKAAPTPREGIADVAADGGAYLMVTQKEAYVPYLMFKYANILQLGSPYDTADGFWYASTTPFNARGFRWVWQPYGMRCGLSEDQVQWNPWLNIYDCGSDEAEMHADYDALCPQGKEELAFDPTYGTAAHKSDPNAIIGRYTCDTDGAPSCPQGWEMPESAAMALGDALRWQDEYGAALDYPCHNASYRWMDLVEPTCSSATDTVLLNPYRGYLCASDAQDWSPQVDKADYWVRISRCRAETGYPWKLSGEDTDIHCGDGMLNRLGSITLDIPSRHEYDCAPFEPIDADHFGCDDTRYAFETNTPNSEASFWMPAPDACTGLPAAWLYSGSYAADVAVPQAGGDGSCTGADLPTNCPAGQLDAPGAKNVACTGVDEVPSNPPTPPLQVEASVTESASATVTGSASATGSAKVVRGSVRQTATFRKHGRTYKATAKAPVYVTAVRTAVASTSATVTATATRTCLASSNADAVECATRLARAAAEALAPIDGRNRAVRDAQAVALARAQDEAATAARSGPVTRKARADATRRARAAAVKAAKAKAAKRP